MYVFGDDEGRGRLAGYRQPIVLEYGGGYRLAMLTVLVDGTVTIDNRDLGLAGLREMVDRGAVVTAIPDGALMGHPDLGTWRVTEAQLLGAEDLITEVEDVIARGQGKATSTHRCHDALRAYLADRSEQERLELRAAYLAVPSHRREYLLGDMDHKDWALQVITGELGQLVVPPLPPYEAQPITPDDQNWAVQYLEERISHWA